MYHALKRPHTGSFQSERIIMGERFGRIGRFGRPFRDRASWTQWTIWTPISGVLFIGNAKPARRA